MSAILPFVPLPRAQSAPMLGGVPPEPTTAFADLLDDRAAPAPVPTAPAARPGGDPSDWLRTQLLEFARPAPADAGAQGAAPQALQVSVETLGISETTLPPPVIAAGTLQKLAPEPMAAVQAVAVSTPSSPPPVKPAQATAAATTVAVPLAAAISVPDPRPVVSLARGSKDSATLQPGLIRATPATLPVASVADAAPLPVRAPAIQVPVTTRGDAGPAVTTAPPTPIAPRPVVLPAPEPSAEPAALPALRLQQGKPAAPLRTRMFGFAELGMFGEFGAQFAAAQAIGDASAAPPYPLEPLAAGLAPPAAVALEALSQTVARSRTVSAPLRAPAIPLAMNPALRSAAQAAVPFDGAAPPPEFVAIAPEPVFRPVPLTGVPETAGGTTIAASGEDVAVLSGGAPARLLLRDPAPPAPNPFNLLVTGPAGALSVAVRSAGETARDFAKLRRLAEDTAAEFGMDLADFQLNGSAPEHGFTSMLGGTNGHRTR